MSNTKSITALSLLFLMTTSALALAQFGPPPGGRGFPPPGSRGPQRGPGGTDRLLDDLSLSSMQQGLDARAALVAYDQSIRQQTVQARRVLLDKMRGILSSDQFTRFNDELNQVPLLPQLPPPTRAIATADLVDRVMGFDKNQDGTVTKDELPERMLNLFDDGDTNQDGALDRAELGNLAARASVNDRPGPRGGGRGGRGGPPPGGFPPGPPQDQQ